MRTHPTVVPTIRRLIAAHLVVALSCWGVAAFAQEQSLPAQARDRAGDASRSAEARSAQPAAEPAKAETGRSRAAGETRDDMALVQGRWERVVKGRTEGPVARVVKEIRGNKETVTYFDDQGKVTRQHRVDFVLDSAGPVKIFTFSNQEILEGPDKGRKYPGTVSYVYRVRPREFAEVWGFLPGQEGRTTLLLVWHRMKEGSESDRQPPPAAAGPIPTLPSCGATRAAGSSVPPAPAKSPTPRRTRAA
jgi:hypothetical protein